MPRWMLGVAFALGLLPGLLLYWQARRAALDAPLPALQVIAPPTPAPPVISTEPEKGEVPNAQSPRRAPTAVFDAAELGRMLAERSDQLKASQGLQADLTRQLRELEARMDTLVQEDTKHKATIDEMRELLTSAQKESDAAKIALQSRDTTLRTTEAANQQLRKQLHEANQTVGRRRQASTELEEIARRRESYLTNIMGRYREATELFRAMTLRMDNQRDVGSPYNNDLSRIQQAIQLADEDLRQLRVLSAQVDRLKKDND